MRKILLSLLFLSVSAFAFPDKPVKIIVPLSAGGGLDVSTRIVAQKLSEVWNVPVIVENKTGGQAMTGSNFVAKSEPDGHTLLSIQPNMLSVASTLMPDLNFSWEKDLVGVGYTGTTTPFVLVVSKKHNIKTVKELIKYGKINGLKYGSAGIGGPLHIYGEWFVKEVNVEGIHVPYKGAAPALVDLVSGDLDMMFVPPANIEQFVRTGQLTALAVVGSKRLDKLPDVVDLHSVLPKYPVIHTSFALFAPSGLPKSVETKLNADIERAFKLSFPELVKRDLIDPRSSPPENISRQVILDGNNWIKRSKNRE